MRYQPRADIQRGCRADLAVVDQANFRRTAADVDVEQHQTLLAAMLHGAGAVRRHNRFQRRPCGGANESSCFVGKQLGNLLCVIAPRRFARDDHGAGIDILADQSRFLERVVDQLLERSRFDVPIAAERREQYR